MSFRARLTLPKGHGVVKETEQTILSPKFAVREDAEHWSKVNKRVLLQGNFVRDGGIEELGDAPEMW